MLAAVLAPRALPSSSWDDDSLAPRDWLTGAYKSARTRSEAVPQRHNARTHKLASRPSVSHEEAPDSAPWPTGSNSWPVGIELGAPSPRFSDGEEAEAVKEVTWQCMDDFPEIPSCSEDLPAHGGAQCLPALARKASFAQRCEAGNLLMDGNTYMYNEGRNQDVANSVGICQLSGCWCCVRKQRPLPLDHSMLVPSRLRRFYRRARAIAPATLSPSPKPSPWPAGVVPSAMPSPSPTSSRASPFNGTKRSVAGPPKWPVWPCTFKDRFGNITGTLWRKFWPDFLSGRHHMRAWLGVPHGFRSCAVVGSSGKLLHSRQGDVIDDHEMVMRMNTAPAVGFLNHTGGRTTHRMVATTGFENMVNEHHCGDKGFKCLVNSHAPPWCPVGALILNSFLVDQHKDPRAHPKYQAFMRACGSLVSRDAPMGPHPRNIAHQVLTTKDSHFMTGLAALLVAAMLCNEGVDVYGFDTGDEPPGTLYHFYDDVQPSEKDDFGASKAFYKAFVEAQPDCIRNHD